MITILIKDQSERMYSTASFNEKLEKEIKSKPEDQNLMLKHLAKEFEVLPSHIFKFWVVD